MADFRPLVTALMVTALSCGLCAAATEAQAQTAPVPAAGKVVAEITLDDGSVRRLEFGDFYEVVTMIDPDAPTLQCEAPYIRKLEANLPLGQPMTGIAMISLDFNDYELNRPVLQISGATASSLLAVELYATSTPEEIARWLPDGKPARDGADWVIDLAWDFTPAPELAFDAADPNAEPVKTPPRWIDPDTGGASGLSVSRVKVVADLRLPATWPDPESGDLRACP